MNKKIVNVGGYIRSYSTQERACAAGNECPYCGGRFQGIKSARWCCTKARDWYRSNERAKLAVSEGRIPHKRGRPAGKKDTHQ